MRTTYARCIKRSEIARWDLDYFRDIELDFDRPFLPESLAWTYRLSDLSPDQQLRLNQIRGHAYAYLFRFVEEYIIRLVDSLVEQPDDDPDRLPALELFLEEEKKHQALFEFFEARFHEGFPVRCGVVGDMAGVATKLLAGSTYSVLLLTTMLEWLTQSHYLAYFDDDSVGGIDHGFKELFRLHWVEEAQHARLDSLETLRLAETMSPSERGAGIQEFLALCDALKGVLHEQARHDVDSLEAYGEGSFDAQQRDSILRQQESSYTHAFITLGLRNRHFRKLVDELARDGTSQVDDYLARISDENN